MTGTDINKTIPIKHPIKHLFIFSLNMSDFMCPRSLLTCTCNPEPCAEFISVLFQDPYPCYPYHEKKVLQKGQIVKKNMGYGACIKISTFKYNNSPYWNDQYI
jgi:hypothetical protein